MTGSDQSSSLGLVVSEIVLLLIAGLFPPLFVVGLGYRIWLWIISPDEATAKKLAARREQLKRIVRRPAREMPIHSGLLDTGDDSDPAINEEGGLNE